MLEQNTVLSPHFPSKCISKLQSTRADSADSADLLHGCNPPPPHINQAPAKHVRQTIRQNTSCADVKVESHFFEVMLIYHR